MVTGLLQAISNYYSTVVFVFFFFFFFFFFFCLFDSMCLQVCLLVKVHWSTLLKKVSYFLHCSFGKQIFKKVTYPSPTSMSLKEYVTMTIVKLR